MRISRQFSRAAYAFAFDGKNDIAGAKPRFISRHAAFDQQRGFRKTCLKDKQDTALSHDHYFHSVMGMAAVRSSEYRPELDIYAGCMTP